MIRSSEMLSRKNQVRSFEGCCPVWGREINKITMLALEEKRGGVRQLINFLPCNSKENLILSLLLSNFCFHILKI